MTTNLLPSEGRPNPLRLAETLRGIIECWHELDRELTRTSGKASRSPHAGRVPLDLDVLDAKRLIDELALTYCQILVTDVPQWKAPADVTTPGLLQALIDAIGHFTHHENSLVAWDFAETVDDTARQCWPIARPSGLAWIPLDVKCFVYNCEGEMRVRIDRDKPIDDASLAMWRPLAVCKQDPSHVIDAKLLVRPAA